MREQPPSADEPERSGLRERLATEQQVWRERLDEPIERVTRITRVTLGWFPVRVWRHFLQHNGFLLAAGVSYQALFAIFATLYVAFALLGLWVGGNTELIDQLIELVNHYIPHIISDHGLVTPSQVHAVAESSKSLLSVTGAVALVTVIWTAIGFVTFARRAVTDIFALPFDNRGYLVLKARDFLAAILFALSFLIGGALSTAGTWALDLLFTMFGLGSQGWWFHTSVRVLSLGVSFAINAAAIALLVRFLTGTSLPWRHIVPASLLGGTAMVVLQTGATLLLSYTPTNPLLTTFAVFIGFLLWFRLNGIVILVAAAWMAVSAMDADVPLREPSEEERRYREYQALELAASLTVERTESELASASWVRSFGARRRFRRAQAELEQLRRSAPPEPHRTSLFE